jgi:hypothetical protein
MISGRPESTEYAPYFEKYVSLVPESDLVQALETQLPATLSLIRTIPADRAEHRYAAGKWSVAEMLRHVVDGERVFGFRAFWFARSGGELPGFEQDDFARVTPPDPELLPLAAEFENVRTGHIQLLKRLDSEAWNRRGFASGNSITVRAIASILVGHVRHHEAVLREKYLG